MWTVSERSASLVGETVIAAVLRRLCEHGLL